MGFWSKLRDYARLGAALAGASGVKVKNVPVTELANDAEKIGSEVAGTVKKFKKPKPSASSTGE